MTPHEHDLGARPDWLGQRSAEGWVREGIGELGRAEARLRARDRAAGVLGLRRAAGMALNGALCVEWRPWGRTYVEHLHALSEELTAPQAVRQAARTLSDIALSPTGSLVQLTAPSEVASWLEAAKTIMAHAYAVVHGSAGRGS
jgi:HEPN domain-containing protein